MLSIIQSLFISFDQCFSKNSKKVNLELFCKCTKLHKTNYSLFITLSDEKNLDKWIKHLQPNTYIQAVKLNKQNAIFEISDNPIQAQSLTNLLTAWQNNFNQQSFSKQTSIVTLKEKIDHSYSWINSWMQTYLHSFNIEQEQSTNSLSINEHQIIHAKGVQQNIKQSLSAWEKEDPTWWRNISDANFAFACLSHNLENTSLAMIIEYDKLTSRCELNPSTKMDFLLKHFKNKKIIDKNLQRLILNFELKCLNACTFFKPYKLIYAINDFEHDLQKNISILKLR